MKKVVKIVIITLILFLILSLFEHVNFGFFDFDRNLIGYGFPFVYLDFYTSHGDTFSGEPVYFTTFVFTSLILDLVFSLMLAVIIFYLFQKVKKSKKK
jgi:hypothetical protein